MEEKESAINKEKEYWLITLILCFFLGGLGIHRLYNKKIITGLLQLITLGGLGIWTLIDFILILLNKFEIEIDKDNNNVELNNIEPSNKDWIITFLLCWTLGLFGVHRFYNKKIKTGILQFITLGGLGIWTLIDLICIVKHQFLDKNGKRVMIKTNKNYKVIILIFSVILVVSTIYGTVYLLKKSSKLEKKKIEMDKKEVKIQDIIKETYSSIINVQIFMKNDATEQEIENLAKELNNIDEIHNIEFVSKEQAYNEMAQRLGNKDKVLNGFTTDIFPVSYKFELDNKKNGQKIIETIENLPEVETLKSNLEMKKEMKGFVWEYVLVWIIIEYYKIITILLIILLLIRTIISISVCVLIYKNKNELTI